MKNASTKKGFTLIEMIVSIAIFVATLFVVMSAFLAIIDGDHKSRGLRIATDNLNLSLEDMTRKIKTGSSYNCTGASSGTADCTAAPSSIFSFTGQDGVSRIIYKRGVGSGAIVNGVGASGCGNAVFSATQGCILREDLGFLPMLATSPEVDVTSLKFYVSGSAPCGTSPCVSLPPVTDQKQPMMVVVVDGSLGVSTVAFVGNAGFKIQTAITQRAYDN